MFVWIVRLVCLESSLFGVLKREEIRSFEGVNVCIPAGQSPTSEERAND